MARTGSGKTAAFLVPMFERLKAPQAKTGARAIIMTPTRELALQTMKFTKEVRLSRSPKSIIYFLVMCWVFSVCFVLSQLGRFTGLKTALILGGDRWTSLFVFEPTQKPIWSNVIWSVPFQYGWTVHCSAWKPRHVSVLHFFVLVIILKLLYSNPSICIQTIR